MTKLKKEKIKRDINEESSEWKSNIKDGKNGR